MVFSSTVFLFRFFPAVLALYFCIPRRAFGRDTIKLRNFVLFIASLVFYAWGEPVYVALMLVSTALDYVCGWGADRFRGRWQARLFLLISVMGNLGMLGFFKYYGSTVGGIALPIGISFYTFQTMSYTIDVYRGNAPVQRNIISLGAYVALFPQLIAGPIVRYATIAQQLNAREHSLALFGAGMRRFIVGLAKKLLLANSMGLLWTQMQGAQGLSVLSAWLGIVAFAFQIYFDFSGYSDMAIGLGKMFGFDFPENFDYPYISRSVSEFWRRWHMSLGAWFRDYVYFPLGGSRKGKARTALNLAIVWTLTGIWHGASWNYMFWGMYFGVLIIMEKLFFGRALERLRGAAGALVRHAYLILAVLLGWTLFAFEDMGAGARYLGVMLGLSGAPLSDNAFLFGLSNYGVLLAICLVASLPLCKKLLTPGLLARWDGAVITRVCAGAALLGLLGLSVAFLLGSSFNPFLYFRF